jgi:hypothetical protein
MGIMSYHDMFQYWVNYAPTQAKTGLEWGTVVLPTLPAKIRGKDGVPAMGCLLKNRSGAGPQGHSATGYCWNRNRSQRVGYCTAVPVRSTN